MIAALILSAALAAQPAGVGTTPEGEVGFLTADGTIVTEEVYNEWFANPFSELDALEYVFGLKVEREPVDVSVPTAERPRELEGEELLTVQEIMWLLKFAR